MDMPTASDLLPLEDALARLLAAAPAPPEAEIVPLRQALKRVLAHECRSRWAVPPHDNSAVDGYAVAIADLGKGSLPVRQRIAAGDSPRAHLPGSASRIFTGAAIPAGADAVVMQEQTTLAGENVTLLQAPTAGQNIRPQGQDLPAGGHALDAGTRLRPQELGLLASIGMAELAVHRKLRVAILTTGNELIPPGQSLAPGQIYNTNRFSLLGLLDGLQLDVVDCGDVADTAEATREALQQAAKRADVIITTGGVSVGEEDHVREAIESLGQLELWRLAIKPGKPLAFGHIERTPVLGLPGNPAAVLVTFLMLARPFLLKMQGMKGALTPHPVPLPAHFSVPMAGNRREFMRVLCQQDAEGQAYLEAHPNQSSGMLSSAAWASGLAVIQEGRTLKLGESVPYYSFDELLS
tara:strand:+ start:4972 stop:6198 length:1227 start_codon:yes stop_codon:yes gene_type:complete